MATDKKPQIQKFRETAREVEADEDEAAFDAALKKVAKSPPKESKLKPKKRDH